MNSLKSYPTNYTSDNQFYQTGSFGTASNPPTFRSLRPSSCSIPDPDQYLQQYFQPRLTELPNRPQNSIIQVPHLCYSQYEASISNTNTNMSIPLNDSIESEGSQKQLRQLEQKIVEQLLMLRQTKLTLMEQCNTTIQNRYQLQREINRIKKKNQKNVKNVGKIVKQEKQKNNHNFSTNSYLNLKTQIEEQLNDQELKMLQKIENLRDSCHFIEQQMLNQSKQPTYLQKTQQSESSHQNYGLTNFNPTPQTLQLERLRIKKQKLLNLLANHTNQSQLRNHLTILMQSNKSLQQTLGYYHWCAKNKIKMLRDQIQKQEQNKRLFFADLVKLKADIKGLKSENQEIKRGMTMIIYR